MKFNLNDHIPAIDSVRTTVCWEAPLGSRGPRLKPIQPIGKSGTAARTPVS